MIEDFLWINYKKVFTIERIFAMSDIEINPVRLKENIVTAVQESCETISSTVLKILDAVKNIKYETREPGVELVDSLKAIINVFIENAIEHKCDTDALIRGIIIGAFRSKDTVAREAHKTIDHLVQLILKEFIDAGQDPMITTESVIKGILEISREKNLNLENALSEAGTSAVLAAHAFDDDVELKVRKALSKDFSGFKVELKEEFLSRANNP